MFKSSWFFIFIGLPQQLDMFRRFEVLTSWPKTWKHSRLSYPMFHPLGCTIRIPDEILACRSFHNGSLFWVSPVKVIGNNKLSPYNAEICYHLNWFHVGNFASFNKVKRNIVSRICLQEAFEWNNRLVKCRTLQTSKSSLHSSIGCKQED